MASSQRKQRGIKNDLSVSQTVALFLAILLSVPGVLGEDCRLLSEPCLLVASNAGRPSLCKVTCTTVVCINFLVIKTRKVHLKNLDCKS